MNHNDFAPSSILVWYRINDTLDTSWEVINMSWVYINSDNFQHQEKKIHSHSHRKFWDRQTVPNHFYWLPFILTSSNWTANKKINCKCSHSGIDYCVSVSWTMLYVQPIYEFNAWNEPTYLTDSSIFLQLLCMFECLFVMNFWLKDFNKLYRTRNWNE